MKNFFNFDWIEMLKRLNQINNTNPTFSNTFQHTPYTNNTAPYTQNFMPVQNNQYTPPFTQTNSPNYNSFQTFNQTPAPKYTDIFGSFDFPETNRIEQLKHNIMTENWNNDNKSVQMGDFVPTNQNLKFPNVLNNTPYNFGKSFFNNPYNNQPKQMLIGQEQPFKTEQPKPDIPQELKFENLNSQEQPTSQPEIPQEPKPDISQEPKPLTLDERHQKAKEFKGLYSDVSKNLKNIKNTQEYSNGDWQYLDSRFDKDSNYKAVALKNDKTGEINVFNIGTDKYSLKDLNTDKDMIFNKTPKQFTKAEDFHKELKTQYGDKYKINSIGHSEGGSESQYVGLNNKDINVYTYNAYGIGRNKEIKEQIENTDTSNIYNYRDSRDPVSKHGKNIGKEYIVESDKKRFLPFGYFKFHGIDNMAEIDNPIDIEEYKKKNPRFVSNMEKVLLSSEDVGKMDTDTFRFYESYIDELLKKKMLMPSYELNKRISNGMNIQYNPAGYYQFL